ncbi:hypothetical protein GYQ39_05230 [Lactococcus piscium]|uniref:hypothetical protein n=1 Tax=Pseudolactococcus carnosus TaxID=2749961 RepID=UPI001FBBEBCE|nr:hypothetical protein [Lactococcus carnosus]MCJ2000329.1 hypothetical protein [Lactococcus carnosus]
MAKLRKVPMQIVTVVVLTSATLALLTTPAKKILHGPISFANKRLVFTGSYTKKFMVLLKYYICAIDQLHTILVGGL